MTPGLTQGGSAFCGFEKTHMSRTQAVIVSPHHEGTGGLKTDEEWAGEGFECSKD